MTRPAAIAAVPLRAWLAAVAAVRCRARAVRYRVGSLVGPQVAVLVLALDLGRSRTRARMRMPRGRWKSLALICSCCPPETMVDVSRAAKIVCAGTECKQNWPR